MATDLSLMKMLLSEFINATELLLVMPVTNKLSEKLFSALKRIKS